MSRIGISLEHRQTVRMDQRLVITPQLQQAIKLLQLNHMELSEILQEELLDNPMLEISQEEEDEEIYTGERDIETVETQQNEEDIDDFSPSADLAEIPSPDDQQTEAIPETFDEIDWEAYFQDMEYNSPSLPSNREDFDADLPSLEARLSPQETLAEHLMQQLRMMRLNNDVKQMTAFLIGNLNDDGWLVLDEEDKRDVLDVLAEQIARQEREEDGGELDGEESLEESIQYWRDIAEEALRALQQMEPSGVGARDLTESLLIQIRQRDDIEAPEIIERLLRDHLKHLERRNYAAIGKKMKISLESLVEATKLIAQMDPKPGRSFAPDPPSYISPDIHIQKTTQGYHITLNDDGLPKLKISQFYKQAMRGQQQGKDFIQEKLRNAAWLLRSIHQRQQTIYKVTDSILKRQREFFDYGLEHLKPMILRDVAEDIEMHESTVSRVTTNKYVHTPQGVFELKFFFTSSLQATDGGEDISSLTVKEKIKKMIAEEDPRDPLSDQQIVKLLESEGIQIARRTIAKYRGILNLPSSSQRKQIF